MFCQVYLIYDYNKYKTISQSECNSKKEQSLFSNRNVNTKEAIDNKKHITTI